MQNKQFISDIEPIGSAGKKVESPFSIKYRHPPKAYKNGFMFTIGLADKTGEIEATFWGGKDENEVRNLYSSMKDDNVIYVTGTVGVFRDKTKIDINDINGIKLCKEGEYNLEDFVPVSEKDINLMFSELLKIVDSIKNIHLKALLDLFFRDSVFSDNFKKAPAAMYIHHAYIGGLLEHTLNVAKNANLYSLSILPSIKI